MIGYSDATVTCYSNRPLIVRSNASLGSSREVTKGCGVSFINCLYLILLIISQIFCTITNQTGPKKRWQRLLSMLLCSFLAPCPLVVSWELLRTDPGVLAVRQSFSGSVLRPCTTRAGTMLERTSHMGHSNCFTVPSDLNSCCHFS